MAGSQAPGTASPGSKVVLVGWDSADWNFVRELTAANQLPCLARLMAAGASGALESYAPYLSPMLWTTLATGKDPEQHGLHGFATFHEQTGRAAAISSRDRRAPALWNILSREGLSSGVVGWLGTHPAESIRGVIASDAFCHPGTKTNGRPPPGGIFPPEREADLAELRLSAADVDPGILGLLVPQLEKIDPKTDFRPSLLLHRLAELYTTHNTVVALAGPNQPNLLAVYFHFIDIVGHTFMPFHQPAMPGTNPRDAELYRDVMSGAYRLQDLLLADLLSHCAPDTHVMVVSDHGFASGADRPLRTPRVAAGIAAWHRRHGIFVAAGPAIKAGSASRQAALRDVTPTVLALLGLPRGEDMPGRVLDEIFLTPSARPTIPSWDPLVPANSAAPAIKPEDESALLRQFVELGYLDTALLQPGAAGDAHEDVRIQNRWSLGVALVDLGHPARALPYLQEAFLAEPESAQYAFHLARCLLLLGLRTEVETMLAVLTDAGEAQPRVCLLLAQLALLQGRPARALELARTAQQDPVQERESAVVMRTALILLRRFGEARRSIDEALAVDPNHPQLHAALAHVRYWQGDVAGAGEAARHALRLQPSLPLAERVLARLSSGRKAVPPRARPSWAELAERGQRRQKLRSEFAARERRWREQLAAKRATETSPAATPGARPRPKSESPQLIVSGAPRSGTSLMMRMLALAGVPVLVDGVRPPDEDNPLGYFEWEPAKQLRAKPRLIDEAEGHVVKIVSPLLRHLPADRDYRILFLRRDPQEIARSQSAMLGRQGRSEPMQGEALATALARHVEETLAWAATAPHLAVLEVPFAELVAGSPALLESIVNFVGRDRVKRPAVLAAAIQPSLYRQRRKSPPYTDA